MNWIAYARSAAADSEAISRQLEQIEKSLVRAGLIEEDEPLPRSHSPGRGVFVDDGQSGASPMWERPGGAQLLDYCRSHKQPTLRSGLIVVTEPSRFGRHDSDITLLTWAQLGAVGWVPRFI